MKGKNITSDFVVVLVMIIKSLVNNINDFLYYPLNSKVHR